MHAAVKTGTMRFMDLLHFLLNWRIQEIQGIAIDPKSFGTVGPEVDKRISTLCRFCSAYQKLLVA